MNNIYYRQIIYYNRFVLCWHKKYIQYLTWRSPLWWVAFHVTVVCHTGYAWQTSGWLIGWLYLSVSYRYDSSKQWTINIFNVSERSEMMRMFASLTCIWCTVHCFELRLWPWKDLQIVDCLTFETAVVSNCTHAYANTTTKQFDLLLSYVSYHTLSTYVYST